MAKNKNLEEQALVSPSPPKPAILEAKSFCVQVWLRASVQCSWKTTAGSSLHSEEMLLRTSIPAPEPVTLFFQKYRRL